MESQRSFLVIGLALVSFLLWNQWQVDYGPKPVASTEVVQATDAVPAAQSGTASADVPAGQSSVSPAITATGSNKIITVTTDSFEVLIDTKGGDVISAKLLKFPLEIEKSDPIQILSPTSDLLYVAQSGLVGKQGPDSNPQGRPIYNAVADSYSMTEDTLRVPLTFVSAEGISYTKTFIFTRDSHAINVEYQVTNSTDSNITFQQYAQLKQVTGRKGGSMFMPTYRGAAYSTEEERYKKYDFSDIEDENLKESTLGGWVAMLEHYFVSSWVPPQENTINLYSRVVNQNQAVIGYTGSPVTVAPRDSTTVNSTLYIGPKDQETLANLARGLDLTVDYGFLWWLAQPLFSLLSFIQGIVINWGAAIVIITVIVKGLMYPLTKAQYESMAKMRALAPKIQALKERYGDDRQKMSQGMMELYKKEKTNPMGGCFPLLLQMPIFLALYWVLLESVELRHAGFIFWIEDLSVMDPYFVLPVLTGASMYLLQKLNPVTVQDPMQQKIMQWMPVAMSIFFLWFPAGLVLYWLISNVITLVQAKLIYAAMEKKGIKVS
ncbi:membrane protein insertase YidC [Planctobacterium marinum]|uniref:membrane protein insertase YidC n=1 Tax=Planctobacterium marinum TaxID=1631968 RepID=UPI001E49D932|nr:membrane protein insertase YidC [Planctobacterium marinum]MCC2607211.1 membrane protein insertase YidC [Planctobacterium marinum]